MNEKKEEIRVEDRRYFDRDGNPIRQETVEEKKEESSQKEERSSRISPPERIDFVSVLFSYVHTALIYLGEVEDPISHKKMENLQGARQMIDILELMQEKTKGNLTSQEEQYLEQVLFDLRMGYMQKAKIIK